MQLTLYTDYSLRVLLYVHLKAGTPSTIAEIAGYYGISRNHLVKVVHNLARLGYLSTTRGKGGGIQLAVPAKDISIGKVVRDVEPSFDVVDCFPKGGPPCRVAPVCRLQGVLAQATAAFLNILDQYSLDQGVSGGLPVEIKLPVGRPKAKRG